jgi:ATP synthase protein I
MDEPGAPDPLKELGARIDKAMAGRRRAGPTQDPKAGGTSAVAFGMRIGLELVAVGVAIGLGLDRWLGIRPWGMLAGFFLGVAAGMVNVYRAATGIGMAIGYRRNGSSEPDRDWDED